MISIRNYAKAESLEEAWQLKQRPGSRVLGGMLWIKMESGNVQTAIDLSGLGLDRIEETPEGWRIGCMTTLRALELHEGLAAYTGGAMREALRHIVGVQFRNLATVGGSVFGRFGFSDVCTMLAAMDSYVELYRCGVMPMRDFLAIRIGNAREDAAGRAAECAARVNGDILVSVLIRKEPARYFYQSVRNSQTDFPVLACGAAWLPEEGGHRLRLSVGARPGRAVCLEGGPLFGETVTEEEARAFGAYAKERIPTESNLRGSAAYRSHLAGVLAARAALQLGGNARC